MPPQDQTSFASALKQALDARSMSQADLARNLNVAASQVNRWVRGKAFPQRDNVPRIEKIIGVNLSAAFNKDKPKYELFVSAPVSGIASEDIPAHHEDY